MQNILSAIYTKFTGSGAFYTSIGGKMHLEEIPQGTVMPYISYHLINDDYSFQFALNGQFEDLLIQFSIFSSSHSSIEAYDIFDDLIALYDWCALTITGYTHLYMRRERYSLRRDEIDKYWQIDCDYRVFVEKT